MKPSRYNHLVRRHNKPQVLYNSWHHRSVELDGSQAAIYGGLSLPITYNLINQKDPSVAELIARLYAQDFMIDDHRDELRQIMVLSHIYRFDRRRLELWIAPTTRCGQACQECPHSANQRDLSPEGWDSARQLVAERAPGLKRLAVTWWGGEPALAWPAIADFDEHLVKLSAKHGFDYHHRVISNGGEALVGATRRLSRPPQLYLNIDSCHDKLFAEPEATFLGTLSQIADHRGNLPPKSRVRTIRNIPGDKLCRNINQLCRNAPDLEDSEVETLDSLLADGFRLENLPRPKLAACQAVDPQSLIIDAEGRVYRCWAEVGNPEKSPLGGIEDPLDPGNFRWLDWEPFKEAHCRVCNILPWCMGGCRARPPDEDCSLWHYAIREMLELTTRQP